MGALPFLKPEYVFRPSQALRRLWRSGPRNRRPEHAVVRLPWGHALECSPRENVGQALWHLGVYDLALTETIARLLEPGELACDVGANLGYMTSIMSHRAGPHGRVVAFEPHPAILPLLERNARASGPAPIEVRALALSDTAGEGTLYVPHAFSENAGLSSIVPQAGGDSLPIQLARWDDFPEATCTVGVMKLDTEGAELQVLKGAHAALEAGRIRDLLFEDHWRSPHSGEVSPTSAFLQERGYQVFRVERGFWGPASAPWTREAAGLGSRPVSSPR